MIFLVYVELSLGIFVLWWDFCKIFVFVFEIELKNGVVMIELFFLDDVMSWYIFLVVYDVLGCIVMVEFELRSDLLVYVEFDVFVCFIVGDKVELFFLLYNNSIEYCFVEWSFEVEDVVYFGCGFCFYEIVIGSLLCFVRVWFCGVGLMIFCVMVKIRVYIELVIGDVVEVFIIVEFNVYCESKVIF